MTELGGLLAALVDAGVAFIVVGGVAGTAHGAARLTQDLDIVYARDPDNLGRIVAALASHAPYPRGGPPGLPFAFDAQTLRNGGNFTLHTDLGDIDLLADIAGGGGYAALAPFAVTLEAFGRQVNCLGLRRLIEVKRAAGRPKDFEAIAELELLLEERGEGF
jgi:hypothetical protein